MSISWSPDGSTLAVGTWAGFVDVWDVERLRHTTRLEGHEAYIRSVRFSADGRLLASKADDGTVRLWRCDSWQPAAVLPSASKGLQYAYAAAFHPTEPLLATTGEDVGVIDIWFLDVDRLLSAAPAIESVQHATAKVVLVGESGVGKTGLGWRLAHGEFRDHPSTHGQQFWVLDALKSERADGTRCEAVLWDLAGQPDYRLIHALFLDDADLALVLFDPTERRDPLRGPAYWLNTLRRSSGAGCPSILVAARVDRGGATLTDAEIEAFCREQGVAGRFVCTSALAGTGLEDLLARIKAQIRWDEKVVTVTTATFKRIRDHVLGLKERPAGEDDPGDGREAVVVDAARLRQLLEAAHPGWRFTDSEMLTAVGHLAKYGYVQVLRTAEGARSVLLQPELLNNLAASFVLEARRNPRGLGSLDEARVLAGGYPFLELNDLDAFERNTLLDAATTLFLERALCFRETGFDGRTLLIFPELINLKKPPQDDGDLLDEDVSYVVTGATQNVYAALVVLLGYTPAFRRTAQWQDEARYETHGGAVCGFRQLAEADGRLELTLLYGADTPQPDRLVFQSVFEKFLAGRDVSVRRYAPLACPDCGYRQQRGEVIRRAQEGRNFLFCSNCGQKIGLPDAAQPVGFAATDRQAIEDQRAAAERRRRFEAALVGVKALRRGEETRPICFVSYAWGEPEHERWVERILATDLQNAGIDVVLDRWHNAEIGASVPRFIARIESSERILVVGTPRYRTKYENKDTTTGFVVAAEVDLISTRLLGTEEQKRSVLPLLRAGHEASSLPPLLHGRVYADFRDDAAYFPTLFDVILTLYGVRFDDPAVRDLRDDMRSMAEPAERGPKRLH